MWRCAVVAKIIKKQKKSAAIFTEHFPNDKIQVESKQGAHSFSFCLQP
jgi:hypothetical protein